MIEEFRIGINQKNIRKLLNVLELFDDTKERNLEILRKKLNLDLNYQTDEFLKKFIEENDGCVVVLFVKNSDKRNFSHPNEKGFHNLNFRSGFQKLFSELISFQIKNNGSPINVYHSENNNFVEKWKKNLQRMEKERKEFSVELKIRNHYSQYGSDHYSQYGSDHLSLYDNVNFFHLPEEFYSINDKYLSCYHKSSIFFNFISRSLKHLEQQNFFHEEKSPYENFFVLKSRNLGIINFFSGYADNLIPVSFFECLDNEKWVTHSLFFYIYLISNVIYNIEDGIFLNIMDHYLSCTKRLNLLARSLGIITIYHRENI